MKNTMMVGGLAALFGLLMLSGGCDWGSGGGNSFNSSEGAGVQVNFSGYYSGNYPDGKAVETSSGAPITHLTMTEAGNACQVIDNNGNKYNGSFGSPGLVYSTGNSSNSVIPAGAELMNAQVNFSGTDYSSGHKVTFVGVIHVVAVQDIQTTVSGSGSGATNGTSTTGNGQAQTTTTSDDGTNTVVTETIPTGSGTTTIVTTYNDTTHQQVSQTTTTTANASNSSGSGSGQSSTYSITGANANYELQGQWVEQNGNTSGVDALSAAGSGVVSQKIN